MFYAELSSSNSRGILDFKSQLDRFIGNFFITYNVIDEPCTSFDVYAGTRVNSEDANLDITRTGIIRTREFSGTDSMTWVGPMIGLRLQQELSESFFLRAFGDIGGFEASSDLTWQAVASLGYRINDSASVLLGYRGIGTDFEDGRFGYDVISQRALLGFEFKF